MNDPLRTEASLTVDAPKIEAPAVLITEQCAYCLHWYPKGDFIAFGPDERGGIRGRGIIRRCPKCTENHRAALDAMDGKFPKECGFCNKNWQRLSEENPADPKVHMAIIDCQGTYILACKACEMTYVRLVKERYRGTQFGAQLKL